jgi:hypothetical protein
MGIKLSQLGIHDLALGGGCFLLQEIPDPKFHSIYEGGKSIGSATTAARLLYCFL